MSRTTTFVLLFSLLISSGSSALIIDTFDDFISESASSGNVSEQSNTASGSFLGTDRSFEVTWSSGPNSVDAAIDAGGDSQLGIQWGEDTRGDVTVLWQNIGGVDLTEGGTQNAIGLELTENDLPVDITITVTDGSANSGSAFATTTAGPLFPTLETLLFSSFSGGIDFTDVESIELNVEAADFPGPDFEVAFIASVPEPGTVLLLASGLLGLTLWGRRRD